MDNQPDSGTTSRNPRFVIGAGILATIAVAVVLMAVVGQTTGATGLLPVLTSPTPIPNQNEGGSPSAVPVTFSELNADPVAYLNMPIQVTGGYLKLDLPACPRYSGPSPQWAVVAEELQLDAKGFDRVVRILEPGTEMTIQGIWRLYQGPLGCGKGPSVGSAWYLQVQRIIQPNPLVGNGTVGPVDIENIDTAFPSLVSTETPTVTPTVAPAQPLQTATSVPTVDPIIPTATIEPTSTLSATLVATPVLTPIGATSTAQPGEGTTEPPATPIATATSISGSNPTATPLTPLPPTATPSSGGGYPGPTTATPAPTIDPYP